MEEKKPEPKFDKGDRVAVTGGKKGLGVRGSVFWIGENKWGPGLRYGVKGDDGETYWLDDAKLGAEKDAPPPPAGAEPKGPVEEFDKGDRVRIRGGAGKGALGAVFWIGENKYGPGRRYGVKGDDEETYWLDQTQVERTEEAAPKKAAPSDGAPGRGGDAANEFPGDGGNAYEFSDEDAPPAPANDGGFDDAPPPADDEVYEAAGHEDGDAGDIPF